MIITPNSQILPLQKTEKGNQNKTSNSQILPLQKSEKGNQNKTGKPNGLSNIANQRTKLVAEVELKGDQDSCYMI